MTERDCPFCGQALEDATGHNCPRCGHPFKEA